MKELLQAISRTNKVRSDTLEDLALVLERALSLVSPEEHGCQFCPRADEIIR
jgi:hypothetical protein